MNETENTSQTTNSLLTALELLRLLERKVRHLRRKEVEPFKFPEFAQANREIVASLKVANKKAIVPTERVALTERWAQVKHTQNWDALTRGEIRDLISIPEAFNDPALFELIQGRRPLNKRLLTVVLRSYLNYWQSLGGLRQAWQNLISESLSDHSLNQLSWPAFQHWRKIAPWLLSSQAEITLAKHLAHAPGDLSEAVKNYLQLEVSIQPESLPGLARQLMLDQLLEANLDEFSKRLDQALRYWLRPNADYSWLGHLIVRVNEFQDETLIERVKNWFLTAEGFGDLRLHPGGEWRLIAPEAKAVFNSWLSKEDLEFFFKMILPEQDDPQKRREFWEAYLPCVIRSRILISPEDKNRNLQVLEDMRTQGKTLPGDCKNSSVFIMETKQCYILEFSETGNAAYIYWKDQRGKSLDHTEFETVWTSNVWKAHRKRPSDYIDSIERLLQYLPLDSLSSNSLKMGTEIPLLSGSNNCLQDYSIRVRHNESFTDEPPSWHALCRRWLNMRGIRP